LLLLFSRNGSLRAGAGPLWLKALGYRPLLAGLLVNLQDSPDNRFLSEAIRDITRRVERTAVLIAHAEWQWCSDLELTRNESEQLHVHGGLRCLAERNFVSCSSGCLLSFISRLSTTPAML